MTESPPDSEEEFEPPGPSDGFHEPSDDTKRRNLITAAIIVTFLTFWILLGLRKVLF